MSRLFNYRVGLSEFYTGGCASSGNGIPLPSGAIFDILHSLFPAFFRALVQKAAQKAILTGLQDVISRLTCCRKCLCAAKRLKPALVVNSSQVDYMRSDVLNCTMTNRQSQVICPITGICCEYSGIKGNNAANMSASAHWTSELFAILLTTVYVNIYA